MKDGTSLQQELDRVTEDLWRSVEALRELAKVLRSSEELDCEDDR